MVSRLKLHLTSQESRAGLDVRFFGFSLNVYLTGLRLNYGPIGIRLYRERADTLGITMRQYPWRIWIRMPLDWYDMIFANLYSDRKLSCHMSSCHMSNSSACT